MSVSGGLIRPRTCCGNTSVPSPQTLQLDWGGPGDGIKREGKEWEGAGEEGGNAPPPLPS